MCTPVEGSLVFSVDHTRYIFMNMFTGVVVESFAYVYQRPGGVSVNREDIRKQFPTLPPRPFVDGDRGVQENLVVDRH